MKRSDGIKFLTQCADPHTGEHWHGGLEYPADECPTCGGTNEAGHLGTPGSRYGRNARECAPVAWRLAYLLAREAGSPVTIDDLDHAMSLVVNEHDDVAHIVREYGHGHYR